MPPHKHDVLNQGEHFTTGTKMTGTGYVACDNCEGPVTIELSVTGEECPQCGWDGYCFGRTLAIVWCWRCGHEWDLAAVISRKEAH